MFDFSFISDEKPLHASGLNYAGGIEDEEFVKAQELGLIETRVDYYGNCRWSSRQVQQKRLLLTPAVEKALPNLSSILKQASAASCGLAAFGD